MMLLTNVSYRRQDRSRSATSANGRIMPSLRRSEPIHVSFVALALSFASCTLPAFLAGRNYTYRTQNSTETFNTMVSFEASQIPLVRPLGPQSDRQTRFVEVEQVGNHWSPSFVSFPIASPSRPLDGWPLRGASLEEEHHAGPGSIHQVHKSLMASVEHLVHPAMLAHDAPVRVAIVGDVGLVLAKEVLKHATVRNVDVFVPPGRRGAVVGKESKLDNEYDDPRVSRIQTEPNSIATALRRKAESAGAYDVILWNRSIGWESYKQPTVEDMHETFRASSESLSSHGVMCMSEALGADDRASVPDAVGRAGLESLVDYEYRTTRFWLAMKSRLSRAAWFGRNQAEAELSFRQRLSEVTLSSIASVDSATLMGHKFPSRLSEEAWCDKHTDACGSGHGFDPFVPNAPTDSFQVKHSRVGERAGRGIFAVQDVPEGSTIGMDTCVYGMFLPPSTYKLLTSMYLSNTAENGNEHVIWSDALWKPVHGYVYGYGWVDTNFGISSAGVDASILTFVNHGCNGTYNTGTQLNVTEHTAVLGIGPTANGYVAKGVVIGDAVVYNPNRDRSYPDWGCDDTTRALRDISVGEELLDNYLVFGGSESGIEWEEVLTEIKIMCSGGVGTITKYEESEERRPLRV